MAAMIDYPNDGWIVFLLIKRTGSVIPISLLVALPSGLLAVLIVLFADSTDMTGAFGGDKLKASQLWAAMCATLVFLLGFRTNKAYGRFWDGTTLLHQMWGEWFDAVSCLVAFSSTAKKTRPEEVSAFRHTLVRLMSLCHGSALEEIALTASEPEGQACIDIGGLDQRTLRYLKDCKFDKNLDFNRVEVIIHMIQVLIVEKLESGVLKIPPPILSRVFQTLSRGQVNLANCKKITYTLFPFPYAQVIAFLLILFSIGTPFVMASILEHAHWAFVYTAIPVFGLWSLNYIAGELEIPFGGDDNDLPLEDFQHHMNKSMLMLIREESDILPDICEECTFDYIGMKAKISHKRPKDFIHDEPEKEPHIKVVGRTVAPPRGGPQHLESFLAQAPAPASAPPPDAPPLVPGHPEPKIVDIAKEKVTALEQALQSKMEELSEKLETLMANTCSLSTQLGQSNDAFQNFTKNTCTLTTQLGETTGAMLELSREAQFAQKSVPKSPWEFPTSGQTPPASCPQVGQSMIGAPCCGPTNPRQLVVQRIF